MFSMGLSSSDRDSVGEELGEAGLWATVRSWRLGRQDKQSCLFRQGGENWE